MTKRINVISGPRNISTALMYAFANRDDTTVVDEPMYAYFLHKTDDDHPAKEQVIASQPIEIGQVKEKLFFQEVSSPIYFLKGMAKHYIEMDYKFLLDLENVFLVRDPRQLISSFVKVIPNPKMKDIGLKREWEIFNYLLGRDKESIVLDSNQVLENPNAQLKNLCHHLDIPFSEKMLHWESGPKAYDGVWAPYWYENVHNSTGFGPANRSKPELPDSLLDLYEESNYYYEKLIQYSI